MHIPLHRRGQKRKVNLDTYIYAASFTDDLRYRKDWNFRNAEATIFDAIGKSGLELIENTEISKLNDMLKQALLLVASTSISARTEATLLST